MLNNSVVADWNFNKKFVGTGSLDGCDLTLMDASSNQNNIKLITIGDENDSRLKNILKWSDDNQSLVFNNREKKGIGKYFKTVRNAPINTLTFDRGYTIEVILELPKDIYDPWMGILTREGAALNIGKLNGEKEILTTLSYNDMFQWASHPLNLDYDTTNWSICYNNNFRNGFHYITIVNDGSHTKLYLNGISDIRNPKEEVKGIDLVDGKGWLIGAGQWNNSLSGLFSGKLKRIRISDKALERKKWLIPDPIPTFKLKGCNVEKKLLSKQDNYNFVFIPDTQYMGQIAPEMVTCITEWIAENQKELNIKGVLHLGDITEESIEKEYINADSAFELLDKVNCPYFVTPGNHDLNDGGMNFYRYFGKNRYIGKDYFKEANSEGNSFCGVIKAGSYEYMIISLNYKDIEQDIKWAENILESNENKPTIIFTHDAYNSDNGVLYRTLNGQYIWDNFVSKHNQIFMVVAGHHFAVDHSIAKNNNDNDVLELLIDYQSYPSGGNSWIQLAQFYEEDGFISFKTYSPWVKRLEEDNKTYFDLLHLDSEKDEFIIPFNFKERFDFYDFGLNNEDK
ncbi:metallophosphoesterase [Vallitalea sediminicola]